MVFWRDFHGDVSSFGPLGPLAGAAPAASSAPFWWHSNGPHWTSDRLGIRHWKIYDGMIMYDLYEIFHILSGLIVFNCHNLLSCMVRPSKGMISLWKSMIPVRENSEIVIICPEVHDSMIYMRHSMKELMNISKCSWLTTERMLWVYQAWVWTTPQRLVVSGAKASSAECPPLFPYPIAWLIPTRGT